MEECNIVKVLEEVEQLAAGSALDIMPLSILVTLMEGSPYITLVGNGQQLLPKLYCSPERMKSDFTDFILENTPQSTKN